MNIYCRCLINQVFTSCQRDIKQMMTTAILVTVRTPKSNKYSAIKHKTNYARRIQREYDCITDRETFNKINQTLAKYGIFSKTLKQSSPTIITINHSYVTLLNNIMHDINHKHHSLHNDIRTFDRHRQEIHDTRIVQTVEYNRHYTTSDAGRHEPYHTLY